MQGFWKKTSDCFHVEPNIPGLLGLDTNMLCDEKSNVVGTKAVSLP